MVEIGPGTGALVVYAPAELDGEEIEIRPHGGAWTGRHTAVRARHLGDRVLHAGVFGSVPAGRYDLRLRPSPSSAATARTTTGAVTGAAGAAATLTTPDGFISVAVVDGTVVETRLVEPLEERAGTGTVGPMADGRRRVAGAGPHAGGERRPGAAGAGGHRRRR